MEFLALLLLSGSPALGQEPAPLGLGSGEEVALDELCERHRTSQPAGLGRLSLEDACTVETLIERGIIDDQIVHFSPDGTFIREPLDDAALVEAARVYQQRLLALYGHDEEGGSAPDDFGSAMDEDEPPETQHHGHALDVVADGQGGIKQIFGGSDGRTAQSTPYGYPYTKFIHYVRGRPSVPGLDGAETGCSGVFVDPTHVLTAAHCFFDTFNNITLCGHGITVDECPDEGLEYSSWGTDYNFGYVCYKNGPDMTSPPTPPYEFGDECEFVQDVYFPSLFVGAQDEGTSQGINNDFAVLHLNTTNFPSGMGDGNWMAITSITDPQIMATKVGVVHSYPNARPDTSPNWAIAPIGWVAANWPILTTRQYKGSGTISSTTTQAKIKTDLDAGSGGSGAPIFYYSNNGTVYTGQAHYILGLMTWADDNHDGLTTFPTDWNGGPSANRFRQFVYDIIP